MELAEIINRRHQGEGETPGARQTGTEDEENRIVVSIHVIIWGRGPRLPATQETKVLMLDSCCFQIFEICHMHEDQIKIRCEIS